MTPMTSRISNNINMERRNTIESAINVNSSSQESSRRVGVKRRILFGGPPPSAEDIKKRNDRLQEEQNKRWDFDFQKDKPLENPHQYSWEPTGELSQGQNDDTSEDVPASSMDPAHDFPPSASDTVVSRRPKPKLTDYYRQVRIPAGHSNKKARLTPSPTNVCNSKESSPLQQEQASP